MTQDEQKPSNRFDEADPSREQADEDAERQKGMHPLLIFFILGVVLTLPCIAIFVIPHFIEKRIQANERSAISSMGKIYSGELLFLEKGGLQRFGTLRELAEIQYIEDQIGSGTKDGYRFVVKPSKTDPKNKFVAIATPIEPGITGARIFYIDQGGACRATLEGTPTSESPAIWESGH